MKQVRFVLHLFLLHQYHQNHLLLILAPSWRLHLLQHKLQNYLTKKMQFHFLPNHQNHYPLDHYIPVYSHLLLLLLLLHHHHNMLDLHFQCRHCYLAKVLLMVYFQYHQENLVLDHLHHQIHHLVLRKNPPFSRSPT
ncbi:MAG: hypothetical protein EBS89_00195 [Proteobacteria bacterium]|nr:hypothetical protein [Pseudomonadota bacterium]